MKVLIHWTNLPIFIARPDELIFIGIQFLGQQENTP